MDMDMAISLLGQMFRTGLTVATPLLLITLITGIVISVFQVVTQIQEMTLTFVPKIFISVVTLYFLGHWMLTTLVSFARNTIRLAAGF